jgi:chemotaxis protein methyltransferase CheR
MIQVENEMDASVLEEILEQVHHHTGIQMTERKKNLLQGRLRSRLSALKLETYRAYLDLLKWNAAEVQEFVNLVTTNETQFFRTPRIWSYFTDQFLPEWTAAHPKQTLKIWSAAASTGEEAYSISMICAEWKVSHPDFNYKIVGTDISSDVLETGKIGFYQGKSAIDLKNKDSKRLEAYFSAVENGYQVKPEIKAPVSFSLLNLYRIPSHFSGFDIVFLRNVLIYFSAADQEKVLANVRRAMKPNASLILGESESLSRLKTQFKYHMPLIYKL